MLSSFYPFRLFFRQKGIKIPFFVEVTLGLAMWFALLFYIPPSENAVFLHYNILFGIDYAGEWWRVFYLPLSALVMGAVNFFLAWVFFEKDRLMSYILMTAGVIVHIFLSIASALIIFLNI